MYIATYSWTTHLNLECHGYWEILPNYAYIYQCIHIVTFCPTYIPYMNLGVYILWLFVLPTYGTWIKVYIYILWLLVLPTYMLIKHICCEFLSCDFLSARVNNIDCDFLSCDFLSLEFCDFLSCDFLFAYRITTPFLKAYLFSIQFLYYFIHFPRIYCG